MHSRTTESLHYWHWLDIVQIITLATKGGWLGAHMDPPLKNYIGLMCMCQGPGWREQHKLLHFHSSLNRPLTLNSKHSGRSFDIVYIYIYMYIYIYLYHLVYALCLYLVLLPRVRRVIWYITYKGDSAAAPLPMADQMYSIEQLGSDKSLVQIQQEQHAEANQLDQSSQA